MKISLITTYLQQVCVQLPTSAEHAALPASAAAAERRPAGRAAIDRYLLAAGPTAANPQQPEQWNILGLNLLNILRFIVSLS